MAAFFIIEVWFFDHKMGHNGLICFSTPPFFRDKVDIQVNEEKW